MVTQVGEPSEAANSHRDQITPRHSGSQHMSQKDADNKLSLSLVTETESIMV